MSVVTWGNWGYSNRIERQLTAGRHTVTLFMDARDRNMNGVVNNAIVDRLEVVRL